jgi:hypothetical protein
MLTAILDVRGTFLGTHCGPLAPRNGISRFIVSFRFAKGQNCNSAARCFNVLNHPNFAPPVSDLQRSESFGQSVKPSAIFWPAPYRSEALMPSTRLWLSLHSIGS